MLVKCQIVIISMYSTILESPYDNGFFTGHVYRIEKIFNCKKNILQDEQLNLQSSSDKLYDEMQYE